ncbi:MAG: Uma2 family endonuclease [Acidobacteria bacterium]|nr:MAG: Uma2 family endonuclease [Acidobacteriota bacterium]
MIETAFVSIETFTSEEFERLMADLPANDPNTYELIDGRIIMTPPAGWPHGRYEAHIVSKLAQFVESCNLGLVFGSSQGFRLTEKDTVAPDAAYVSNQRWAESPSPVVGKPLRVIPNLVVEILSPTTAKNDLEDKRALYERCGIDEYWIVDPQKPSITILALKGGQYEEMDAARGHGRVHSRILPGFSVALEEIAPST